ncbi:MAG: metallophosphoesterase family protein [Thermoleophilia bacterium]|nr:metallophosphoesterase family protein [Thermoleophilia bacterium]
MIAVISDVHSNLQALQAVLADVHQRGCKRIWCLGDTVGYAANPAECVDLVFEHCEVVLAGNHDLAVVGDERASEHLAPGMYHGGPGAGIELAKNVLGDARLQLLKQLDAQLELDNIELSHGSSRNPIWEYVRSADVATTQLTDQHRELAAVGHTHIPLLWELSPDADEAHGGTMPDGSHIVLERGTRRVFNPGSVGQPRDRDPRAAWALLDGGTLSFHRTEYDIAQARAAITAARLPTETGERLELGW